MRHVIGWVAKYGDELVAIVLALAVATLAITDVIAGSNIVLNTVLLVLAAITASNLRDRFRARSMHEALVSELTTRAAELRHALEAGTEVRVVTGNEVAAAHARARENTSIWVFRGGTGTYLRARTLPDCIGRARARSRHLEVRIEIIDPRNDAVCNRYARYRDTLSAHQPDRIDEPWTIERTRKESYATILAACMYHQQYDLLDIEVGLSNRMSTFRWDLSSHAVILTQEDPFGQTLVFTDDKTYYHYWEIELRNSFQQTEAVSVARVDHIDVRNEPSVEDVRELFSVLDLPLPATYTEHDVTDIVIKAIRPRNPYD